MTTPWLSVISVIKDDVEGFQRTLQSIREQDTKGIELVVVDSSEDRDAVKRTLADFALPREYHWMPADGVYPAMNAALDMATGEYTYFANAGDEFFAGNVVAQARSHLQGAVWAFGPVEIVQENGERVFTPYWEYHTEWRRGFSRGLFPSHQGTFVKREILQSVGGFDASFAIAADYAMVLRIAGIADPVVLPFVVGRFHEGGLSSQFRRESFVEFHRARREILDLHGAARVREQLDTSVHRWSVWIARELLPRMRSRSL